MVSPCRHTFSGFSVVFLLAAAVAVGWVAGAPAHAEPHATFAATDACPTGWPTLHTGPPGDHFDGNVSVLAGGNLRVSGDATEAEGVVVALGDATFARETPGSYEVGVVGLGSQVPPYANSDMLVVGGSLTGDPGTQIDVGRGLAGDVVVRGEVSQGSAIDAHGGSVDSMVPDATKPYNELPDAIARMSWEYAALAATGTVEVTETSVTLNGDGVSDPQVFAVDGATLGGAGRSLQLLGVPAGAGVIVNLVGPLVDLDLDTLLSPTGAVVDPAADPYFPELATHLLWNADTAETVDIAGLVQLPGSLVVPSRTSTTTLSVAGTNGRILVGGDLVHTGVGSQLHSYPFLPKSDLGCKPPELGVGTLTVSTELVDPGGQAPDDLTFEGRFQCRLDGDDVTPADPTWRSRPGGPAVVLSDHLPVGAKCTLTQSEPRGSDLKWTQPVVNPVRVVVAKREVRGFVVSNRLLPPPRPPSSPTPTPTPTPTSAPTPTETETPSPTPSEPSQTPGSEPTSVPTLPTASTAPTPEPTDPTSQPAPGTAEDPTKTDAGPVTTAAPFTLRGAFVWGPLLFLSLLSLLLRVRRRPARRH